MFIGRDRELATLNRLYSSSKFEFAVIYGRRRVGKTALITEFLKEKKAIYFMGVESSAKQNLENFSKSIMEYAAGEAIDTSFSSFQSALEYVFKLSMNERIVLAIDEYPYVARASGSLASTLQLLIDKYKDKSKLLLILCGSSMSFMEDKVLSYKAPLYGRKTAQIKMQPFTFRETYSYFKKFSPEECALIYGIFGGTPQYLFQVADGVLISENVKNTFLNPNSPLFEEPGNLLKQEVREPTIYNAIITAVATGASRMSEISTKIGEDSNVCSIYLKNLISLGLVKKETPYGEKMSRKSIYSIEDPMFRFWYRFVPENNSLIAKGAAEIVWNRIEPQISTYMGKIFEDICTEYLWEQLLSGKCPIEFNSLGRWWGGNPKTKKQEEIDIMGTDDKESAIFAECKWTNEQVDEDVLKTLEERSRLFHYKNVHLYIFSKSGFTDRCKKTASEQGNVSLILFGDMIKQIKTVAP